MSDSQVISEYIEKESKAKEERLQKYLLAIRRMKTYFEGFTVKKIHRNDNSEADALARTASQGDPFPPDVFFEVLRPPSVKLQERAILSISPVASEDWRTEIISYLNNTHQVKMKYGSIE